MFSIVTWRSRTWGICYFLQILLFSAIYASNPYNFFHSTSLYEPSLAKNERQLTLELERQIFARMVGPDGWEVPQIYVRIEWDEYHSSEIAIIGLLGTEIATGQFNAGQNFGGVITWQFNFSSSVGYDEAAEISELTDWVYFEYQPDPEWIALHRGWVSAHQGRPARSDGLWFRMLYLSVVTTTTLGYGDIVPLTSEMRFAIAMQTILGVVISAGFIQSLLRNPARPSKKQVTTRRETLRVQRQRKARFGRRHIKRN